jgi:hypothetical protein
MIGALYYAWCGTIIYRLLRTDRWTAVRGLSLGLILLLLVLNADWNLCFFRRRDLKQSFLMNIPTLRSPWARPLACSAWMQSPPGSWFRTLYIWSMPSGLVTKSGSSTQRGNCDNPYIVYAVTPRRSTAAGAEVPRRSPKAPAA